MATALKDIQFSKPVLVGETNANNGTTYALGSNDVIGPIARGLFTLPESGSEQTMWGFDGFAEYAKSALSAQTVYLGSGMYSEVGSIVVGSFDSSYFNFGTTGSWGQLTTAFSHILEVLGPLDSESVIVLSNS